MNTQQRKSAILFWRSTFPKTFDSVMKECAINTYGKALFDWAQGEQGFPYRLEMLKIYSSKKLQHHIKVVGVDGAGELIKKKLEVDPQILTSLAISNFDIKQTLNQALEDEVANVGIDIPPLSIQLEDWLRSYQFAPEKLETVVRNMVRLTNGPKIIVDRRIENAIFEQVNKLDNSERITIGKAGIEEFLGLLKPGMSMIYDGTMFIVQLMKLLFNVEPDFANTMFVKLVEKYEDRDYRGCIVPLVHNIVTNCVKIGDEEPYLEDKARGFKKMLENAISYNVSLVAIRGALSNLVGNARVFLLHGCKGIFNELGDLYVTVESIYKSTN